MIETVVEGFGELLDEIVFVGGAVSSLYIDDSGAGYIRPTQDVDCIIEITSRTHKDSFDELLRTKGFQNDFSEGAPLCRWNYNSVTVDVMPTDGDFLGFTNEWYKEGMKNTIEVALPSGVKILVLALPYFIVGFTLFYCNEV